MRASAQDPGDPERIARECLQAALPSTVRAYPNVRWVDRTRDGGPARDGELDLLLVDPERGLLAIEVKGGIVSRDRDGRWYAGNRKLDESPFKQVDTAKQVIGHKIAAHPDWIWPKPRMLHAVVFPQSEREGLLVHHKDLGPDGPLELVIDRADLATPDTTRAALERVFAWWCGDGARDRTLTDEQLAAIHAVLEPDVVLRPLLHAELDAGEVAVLAPTHHQLGVLKTLRAIRRASILGGAGSGKTLLAAEKARQLATDGLDVLLVCFNQSLAASLATRTDLAPLVASGCLTVSTFHELCRRLAADAGTLPPPPPGKLQQEWWEETLPRALDDAIPKLKRRWQAVVVDEGQDLCAGWLVSLDFLLAEPGVDDYYLFHDPAQALYRPDASGSLGLIEFPLPENCRNARPIHELAYRFYTGSLVVEPMREGGPPVDIVTAEPGEPTLAALGAVLHRLVHVERIERHRIAVLTGVALEHSVAWHKRRFKGDLSLWNGSVDDAGVSLGLSADQVPPQPARTILVETIHRSKGLDWDAVVLVELRPDDRRRSMLLYIGASHAKHHLTVIAPPELAAKLAETAS